jgi:hypothetical protein
MNNNNYIPNGTKEDIKIGILHSNGGYYVSNEGTQKEPKYHVWVPGITHATCDSAYNDISLAICRCDYLANTMIRKEALLSPIHHSIF